VTSPQGGQTAVPAAPPEAVTAFLRLSVILTGFEEHVLRGTGMLQTYYDELLLIIGAREAGKLLSAFEPIAHPDHSAFDPSAFDHTAFQKDVLGTDRYGPVARNVLMMWYLGTWTQLPREWRAKYGATAYDTDHVVSAAAYREGLVWPAAGTHPMSAKQPGFGTWAQPSALKLPTAPRTGSHS
jgi:hypothetical protein